jgi:ubiquinone/menaquinone biosynthesis C-methylase UbiE
MAAVLFIFASIPAALAQEQSVKPGINDNFKDPDVDYYVKLFEGESREIFKHRNEIVDALALEPGMNVADVGAGTGFFSRMFSYQVAPGGTVYAVDIAQNFVDHIEEMAEKEEITNIKAQLCSERSVDLPDNSIDVAFICDVYHHFEFPFDSMASIHHALRTGGRVFIVDFERIVGVSSDFAIDHVRCGKGTVTDEVKDTGFDFVREHDLHMDGQYVIEFIKRDPAADK